MGGSAGGLAAEEHAERAKVVDVRRSLAMNVIERCRCPFWLWAAEGRRQIADRTNAALRACGGDRWLRAMFAARRFVSWSSRHLLESFESSWLFDVSVARAGPAWAAAA